MTSLHLDELTQSQPPDERELALLREALSIEDEPRPGQEPARAAKSANLYIATVVALAVLVLVLLTTGPIHELLLRVRNGPVRACVVALLFAALTWLLVALLLGSP
jgi:hypothetical protein